MSVDWTARTTPDVVRRRAGGRRHINSYRRDLALWRRLAVSKSLIELRRQGQGSLITRGTQAKLAKEFGVSAATMCRDFAEIRRWMRPLTCPTCDGLLLQGTYERLVDCGRIKVPKGDSAADMEVLAQLAGVRRNHKLVDATRLTTELVLTDAAWTSDARVVALQEHEGVGLALVDQGAHGGGVVVTFWRHDLETGMWSFDGACPSGAPDVAQRKYWADGPMVYAVGRGTPETKVIVRYEGELHACPVNEFGFWAYVRRADEAYNGALPQVAIG